MIKAKGKKRRERIEEEEGAIEEFEKAAVVPTVKREKAERQTVDPIEIVGVLRNTFDRLFQEFDPKMGTHERSVYADDRARTVLRVIKHGIPEGEPARIMDEEQRIPLCRNCK